MVVVHSIISLLKVSLAAKRSKQNKTMASEMLTLGNLDKRCNSAAHKYGYSSVNDRNVVEPNASLAESDSRRSNKDSRVDQDEVDLAHT